MGVWPRPAATHPLRTACSSLHALWFIYLGVACLFVRQVLLVYWFCLWLVSLLPRSSISSGTGSRTKPKPYWLTDLNSNAMPEAFTECVISFLIRAVSLRVSPAMKIEDLEPGDLQTRTLMPFPEASPLGCVRNVSLLVAGP